MIRESPPNKVRGRICHLLPLAQAIAAGGRGLGILVADRPRPTEAGAQLRPPEEMLAFLEKWAETREK